MCKCECDCANELTERLRFFIALTMRRVLDAICNSMLFGGLVVAALTCYFTPPTYGKPLPTGLIIAGIMALVSLSAGFLTLYFPDPRDRCPE